MLLVTISLLGYFDEVLIACGVYLSKLTGISFFATSFSFKKFFSAVGIPFAWYLGLPQESLLDAAHVLGLKVAVNEMVAYTECVKYAFDERTKILLTYALAGFSNFSCIGIQLGGIGILAPSIRPIIGRLGVRAVIAAACANLLNAYIVSLLL